jgi:Sec-independent protein secretion pathway component TatC
VARSSRSDAGRTEGTRLVSFEKLKRNRGYVLVSVFVLSAAVTPSDATSMTIIAVSMYLLYEPALFFAGLFLTL